MSFINTLPFFDKVQEHDDIYTFRFVKPKGFTFNAGQHGLFVLPGFYRPHPFSISSSPEEEYVSFSTHIRVGSRFKQRLMALTSKDVIYFVGPVLNFTFDKNSNNHVLLAQGIGITPFRSMLVHAHDQALKDSVTLIHVDNKNHTFQTLTTTYATRAHYPTNQEAFTKLVSKQSTAGTFYISGSPRYVASTKKLLHSMGVTRKHIKTDSFLGY